VCQFCEFNADRTPISTADYADDTDKRKCCPRTTRKTRSHTAQKIRKIGAQEASEEGKSGSHERIQNRREFPGFLVSRFLCEFLTADTAALHLCALCNLGVSSCPRKNLRKSADYRKLGMLPDSADGHPARLLSPGWQPVGRDSLEGYPPNKKMPDRASLAIRH
jgi:hypothetical protein